jgi:hypothetical protein
MELQPILDTMPVRYDFDTPLKFKYKGGMLGIMFPQSRTLLYTILRLIGMGIYDLFLRLTQNFPSLNVCYTYVCFRICLNGYSFSS